MKQPIKKCLIDDREECARYNRETLSWFLSILASTVLYLTIARVLITFYHPDTGPALEFARKHFNIVFGLFTFSPEPTEGILFITAALTYFFSLVTCYWFFSRQFSTSRATIPEGLNYGAIIFALVLVIAIGWLGLMAPNSFAENAQNNHDLICKKNIDFYFYQTFLSEHFIWYLLGIFPAMVLAFFYSDRLNISIAETLKKYAWYFCFLFCAAIIAVVFFISVFRFPYTGENLFDTNMVYYSVVQVFRGSPMLVDHFKNTYGLYPHFLVPVLKITGLSILNFTMIMGILLAFCFALLYILLSKMVSNPILVIFGFTAIFFMGYMYGRIVQPYDSYFAISPIRWLFPFMLALFAQLYFHARPRLMYWGSMVLFSFGILWNPDFGLLTYLVLICYFCFLEFDRKPWIIILRNLVIHCMAALGVAVLTFLAFGCMIKLFYGAFPAFGEIFTTLRVHALVGYGMLPMPGGFHPYMLVAIILVVGILYAVRDLVRRKISGRGAVVFVMTLSGVGAFEYYVGRSHNWNLSVAFPWAFLLLTIYADDLLRIMEHHRKYLLLFAPVLFVLAFSFFQTLYAAKDITALMYEKENKEAIRPTQEAIVNTSRFISSQAATGEKVLILMDNSVQGFIYGLSGTRAAINPGFNELYLKEDYEWILEFLKKNKEVKIFFDPQTYRFSDNLIPAILSSYYSVTAIQPGGTMMCFTRTRPLPAGDFLLKRESPTIFHEQFAINQEKRYRFSLGDSTKLTLDQQFTIQAVIRPHIVPKTEMTNAMTVFTNMNDSTGLMFQQYDTSSTTFLLALHGMGMISPLTPGQWNYIVYSFANGKFNAYSQGRLFHSGTINKAYLESKELIHIGNHKLTGGFFFGDIYEIRISQGIISEQEIAENWAGVLDRLK